MASIIQFYIYSKSAKKLTYKTKSGKFYRNETEIDAEEYNKALEYFNSHR